MKTGPGSSPTPCEICVDYWLGEAEGEPAGDAPPPPLGAGVETVVVFGCVDGATVPNQFQRAKPKKSSTRTISAMSAAAIPAPAPAVSPPVSTTSEPAGLQYLRTL